MSMKEGGRWNERDGRSEMMAVINQDTPPPRSGGVATPQPPQDWPH